MNKVIKSSLFLVAIVGLLALPATCSWASPVSLANHSLSASAVLAAVAAPDEPNVHVTMIGTVSRQGDQFILTTPDGNTYVLDAPSRLAELVGSTIRVSGMLDVDEAVIVVQHIAPAEAEEDR